MIGLFRKSTISFSLAILIIVNLCLSMQSQQRIAPLQTDSSIEQWTHITGKGSFVNRLKDLVLERSLHYHH
jgi:hypothetical protein